MKHPNKINIDYPAYTPTPELLASLKGVEEHADRMADRLRELGVQLQKELAAPLATFAEDVKRKYPQMFN